MDAINTLHKRDDYILSKLSTTSISMNNISGGTFILVILQEVMENWEQWTSPIPVFTTWNRIMTYPVLWNACETGATTRRLLSWLRQTCRWIPAQSRRFLPLGARVKEVGQSLLDTWRGLEGLWCVQVSYSPSFWLRWRIQFQSTQNAGFHRFINKGRLPSNLEQVCTVKLMSNRRARAARLQHQLVKVTMVYINLYSTNPNTSLILDLLSRKYESLVKVSARTRM